MARSRIAGIGLFAGEVIEAGEPVVTWGGAYMSGAEARASGLPFMQWDEDLFSVDDGTDHPAYGINHSCEPNLWMSGAFVLEAFKTIQPGEEITVDYALWIANENYVSEWSCRCASQSCRGRITGTDWRRDEIQQKYRGHFSPLLNHRIDATVT